MVLFSAEYVTSVLKKQHFLRLAERLQRRETEKQNDDTRRVAGLVVWFSAEYVTSVLNKQHFLPLAERDVIFRFLAPDSPLLFPAPFLSLVPLLGTTFPFLCDRNPLWTHSSRTSKHFFSQNYTPVMFSVPRCSSLCCPF